MDKEKLFIEIKAGLEKKLSFLEDKPEETVYSTIKALWFAAAGIPRSAGDAIRSSLPELTDEQVAALHELIAQRLNNTPLAYITNRQNFMGIELLADKRALIPRKETEILARKAVEVSLKIAEDKKEIKVIDVCCGAGNVGLAIAHFNPKAFVSSADLSEDAVNLTQDNISFLDLGDRVDAQVSDLFSAFESDNYYGKIDLITCNPPYISTAKVQKMNSEIMSNEPSMAFDGGMFGTKIIQKLISETPKYLVKGGWLLFELGLGQGEFIMKLCKNNQSYEHVESMEDSQGNIRAIAAKK